MRDGRKTLYLRGLREETVRQAKALAAREGITLTALVERTLTRETATARRASSRLSEIAQDIEWYQANAAALLDRYEGQHVAIVEGQIVDADVDLDALAARISDRYGRRSVFMPTCERTPHVVDVRSPRVAR